MLEDKNVSKTSLAEIGEFGLINQIKEGKPLTITNPHMTRFMMSLQDSVDLVLFAFTQGKPGDILVQKSPAATIGVLAQALKELFNADNEIIIINGKAKVIFSKTD